MAKAPIGVHVSHGWGQVMLSIATTSMGVQNSWIQVEPGYATVHGGMHKNQGFGERPSGVIGGLTELGYETSWCA